MSTGRVEGKVAFITGAARGQGRSHAVRLAEEGADIIAVDICGRSSTAPYPAATPDDLAETAELVKRSAGASSPPRSTSATTTRSRRRSTSGVEQLGRLDIVVANAGIGNGGQTLDEPSEDDWQDMIDVNLTGVWKTVKAAVPHDHRGRQGRVDHPDQLGRRPEGLSAHRPLRRRQARHRRADAHASPSNSAQHSIRVNTVHPTNVNTR